MGLCDICGTWACADEKAIKCMFINGHHPECPNMPEKEKYVKQTRDGSGTYVVLKLDKNLGACIVDDLFESDIGEKITLEVIELTEAEYNALPEFQGW